MTAFTSHLSLLYATFNNEIVGGEEILSRDFFYDFISLVGMSESYIEWNFYFEK